MYTKLKVTFIKAISYKPFTQTFNIPKKVQEIGEQHGYSSLHVSVSDMYSGYFFRVVVSHCGKDLMDRQIVDPVARIQSYEWLP